MVEKQLSYSDACADLKKMYDEKSSDAPRIMRLLRDTFAECRKVIAALPDADVSETFKLFPHLQDMQYVSMVMSIRAFLYTCTLVVLCSIVLWLK